MQVLPNGIWLPPTKIRRTGCRLVHSKTARSWRWVISSSFWVVRGCWTSSHHPHCWRRSSANASFTEDQVRETFSERKLPSYLHPWVQGKGGIFHKKQVDDGESQQVQWFLLVGMGVGVGVGKLGQRLVRLEKWGYLVSSARQSILAKSMLQIFLLR